MAINGFKADGTTYRYNAEALDGYAPIEDGSVTVEKLASGVIDDTLAVDGAAADAKATGDAISTLNDSLSQLGTFGVYTLTGTTTSSGALAIPSAHHSAIVFGQHYTDSTVGFVNRRDAGYFTCYNNSLAALANTAVTIKYAYWFPSA